MKEKNDSKPAKDFFLSYRDHFEISIKIAATTVFTIAFFGGLGYFLDKKIGSFPTLFIIGLGISFVLMQILVYKQAKALIKNKTNKH